MIRRSWVGGLLFSAWLGGCSVTGVVKETAVLPDEVDAAVTEEPTPQPGEMDAAVIEEPTPPPAEVDASIVPADAQSDPPISTFRGLAVVNLADFGAVGDDRSDDTDALQAALSSANGMCLDGNDREYRVFGNLVAPDEFCLINTRLLQTMTPFDAGRFIHSDRKAPRDLHASERIFHPEDPTLTQAEHQQAELRNALRTIMYRGVSSRSFVLMNNVRVMKGLDETLGNGGNAAGIYIDRAHQVDLENVELSGKGQGYGIAIHNSEKIQIHGLRIHDVTWQPLVGQRSFSQLVEQFGWNSVPLYEYDADQRKYCEVRSQEAASGLVISRSEDIVVQHSAVSGIHVRAAGRLYPWQADGITLGNTSRVTVRDVNLSHTWEGIDVSGAANRDVTLIRVRATDSFAYGIKFAHRLQHAVLRHNVVERAGLRALIFGGGPGEKQSDVVIADTTVRDTGRLVLRSSETLHRPWGAHRTAALHIDGQEARKDGPEHFRIVNFDARNQPGDRGMDFGISASERQYIHIAAYNVNVDGATIEGARIASVPPGYTAGNVIEAYRAIGSCTPELFEMIKLWDQSHSSVRNPPYGLPELRNAVEAKASMGTLNCE